MEINTYIVQSKQLWGVQSVHQQVRRNPEAGHIVQDVIRSFNHQCVSLTSCWSRFYFRTVALTTGNANTHTIVVLFQR